MDQHGPYGNPGYPLGGYPGNPPPPPPAPGGWPPNIPPRPQVVHIVAKSGGFWRAVTFVLGMILFGVVFVIGIILGINVVVMGAEREDIVIRQTYRDGGRSTIAIVPVIGGIDQDQAEFVHAAVKNVLDDSSIKAVVLRVDSPGGSVTPSDEIWYEVNRMKEAGLPVIASYGSVAASGGYYVSCGADHIMAEDTSITGSIGVIAQVLTLEGLMDKVGVKPVTLVAKGSPQKDVANDIFRTWNDQDKAKVMVMLDSAYQTFNLRVRDGRKAVISDPATVDALANGSIYTAKQAKDNGLIDSIGYLDDAVAHAEKVAGMSAGSAKVVTIRKPPSLFGDGLFARSRTAATSSALPTLNADSIRNMVNDLSVPRVMYLMH